MKSLQSEQVIGQQQEHGCEIDCEVIVSLKLKAGNRLVTWMLLVSSLPPEYVIGQQQACGSDVDCDVTSL